MSRNDGTQVANIDIDPGERDPARKAVCRETTEDHDKNYLGGYHRMVFKHLNKKAAAGKKIRKDNDDADHLKKHQKCLQNTEVYVD